MMNSIFKDPGYNVGELLEREPRFIYGDEEQKQKKRYLFITKVTETDYWYYYLREPQEQYFTGKEEIDFVLQIRRKV